jgi:hypothetical protein
VTRLLNPLGVLAATAISAGLIWLGHHLWGTSVN